MAAYGSLFLLLAFLTSLKPSIQIVQQPVPNYVGYSCTNGKTYLKNSTYSSNLRTLLSTLSSSNTFSTGFYSLVLGQNPDLVFALYLCRGDASSEVCRDCVVYAINELLNQCLDGKEAFILCEDCMLRYADRNILLDPPTTRNEILMVNQQDVTANISDRFNKVLFSLMNEAAEEASETESPRKFAIKKTYITSSQTVYVMVQCTPGLTRDSCLSCLQRIIGILPRNTIGGIIFVPTCTLRYYPDPSFGDTPLTPLVPAPPLPVRQAILPPPQPSISDLRLNVPKGKKSTIIIIASVVVLLAISVLLFIACYCFRAKRAKKTYETAAADDDGDDITTAGSLQFDFKVVEAATDNFSESNKLGQGGFGQVYEGTLPNGLQVAVKRLSKKSGQGEKEFKNEVVVVAKLQHKNLVKLLGFCLEREEKILVYEFVHNKSLDYFLFDSRMQSQLNWTRRYKIIGGIARGILYLHQDSRLTIIHRDLKAGNILLDADMNPKVADFGMARIFEMDQTEANTRRVVGTYGYMSPEYAMYGHFSMKSDVYSFGVLVLEIISGRKNSSLRQMDGSVCNLVTYTWRLWSSGSPLELVDTSFRDNYQRNEISRCIHIALLCVQEDTQDRPNMSAIVQMLTTSLIALAMPKPPGFFFGNRHEQAGPSVHKYAPCSIDDASITSVAPR
ncbi:PREDICTED: cysteine-rich receptor-like protein kinase 5 [Camelina sativa]|uniref:Cysteine-rich receptor-like protein kinase 5 n=1 Tax=Camelina sativa TaxID=90675 RepID=A0ABM0UZY2_CAMSA|nr:PREDICTED: cysteine-rich receptor-like protein kinase 5 [Camelina sativa]